MSRPVAAIDSSIEAIMAAFDSSVPRMISMYFAIAFSSSGGAASRPSHPHVERAARGSTRPRRNLSPRHSRTFRPAFARQTGPSAVADPDAMLIRKLNVAALEGGNAHTDLGSIRD